MSAVAQDYFWFALFTGLNGLILISLASWVSYRRITLKIANGDGGQKAMKQAIRAHGNAMEHMPMMGLIVLALSLLDVSHTLLGSLVLVFTLSRLLHPVGMLTAYFQLRRLGAAFSYLATLLGALAVLTHAF